jgi:hypothetical protein
MLPHTGLWLVGDQAKVMKLFDLIWLPFLDTYRTMCLAPEPSFRGILESVRELRFAA